MWGDEPQLDAFRERLRLLLDAHQQELNPQHIHATEGEVLFRQGEPVEQLMLLTSGRVAVDVHQGAECHTLAVVGALELLGEVGFFASGRHYADSRVVDGPADLLTMQSQELLKAMLFDSDLVIEMLSLVSERCRRGNRVIALLLNGIEAVHNEEEQRLATTSEALSDIHFCVAKAARQLQNLQRQS